MSLDLNKTYEFGGCYRLTTDGHVLWRNGDVVPLPPKAFDTLLALVRNSGQVLEKERLMSEVWPDTFVEDGNLAQNVFTLRKVLGQTPDGKAFIETIPKRGYRFVAPVVDCSQAAEQLVMTNGSGLLAEVMEKTVRPGSRSLRVAGTAALAFTVAAILLLWARGDQASSGMRVTTLNVVNGVAYGVISPDGKYVAYVSLDYPGESVWVREVNANGRGIRVAGIQGGLWALSYLPNSEFLYYIAQDEHDPRRGLLYRSTALGSDVRLLVSGVNAAPSFSPDGSHMIFKRYDPGQALLVRATAEGADQQVIATSQENDPFHCYQWSPDGRTILYMKRARDSTGPMWSMVEIPVGGGAEKSLTEVQRTAAVEVRWLGPRNMLARMSDPESGLQQLWQTRGQRDFSRLTNDSNDYGTVSLTADRRTMLTNRTEIQDSLWTAAISGRDGARQVPFTRVIGFYDDPVWTPDGRILYVAYSTGSKRDLWIVDATGTQPKALTAEDGANTEPSVSANGAVVFVNQRRGSANIWRVGIDGTGARQLTHGNADLHPNISADGRSVAYATKVLGKWGIWVVAADGTREAVKLADSIESSPVISPDGTLVAYIDVSERVHERKVPVRSLENGELVRELNLPANVGQLRWTRTGKALSFVRYDDAGAQVWNQPLDGGTPSKLGKPLAIDLRSMDWSWDGKSVLYHRRRLKIDLLLISNFR